MNRKRLLFITVGLVVLVGGIWFLIKEQPPIKSGQEVDLEKAEELALWHTNRLRDWEWKAVYTSQATSLESLFFDDYYFIYVWGEFGHADNRPVAVNQKGDVFILPADFNRLIQDKDLKLTDEKEVRELIEFYLELNNPMPEFSYSIIDNIMDIPGISSDGEVQQHIQDKQQEAIDNFGDTVKPFSVSLGIDDSWKASFYTWQLIGGNLESWNIKITSEGDFIVERELLDKMIGSYSFIE